MAVSVAEQTAKGDGISAKIREAIKTPSQPPKNGDLYYDSAQKKLYIYVE